MGDKPSIYDDPEWFDALSNRLRAARCWKDEVVFGTRSTKWFDLRQSDVDHAADACAAMAKLLRKSDAA